MYSKGITTRDIDAHIREIYGLEVSDSTVSRITDKILPIVKEWQQRPLEEIYAVVSLDAVHYHVRSEGQIVKNAIYIAIGINMSGIKRSFGNVGRWKRKCQILTVHFKWSEEPWCRWYPDCIGGRAERICGSHQYCISQNWSVALHHPSNPFFQSVCVLQGH